MQIHPFIKFRDSTDPCILNYLCTAWKLSQQGENILGFREDISFIVRGRRQQRSARLGASLMREYSGVPGFYPSHPRGKWNPATEAKLIMLSVLIKVIKGVGGQ